MNETPKQTAKIEKNDIFDTLGAPSEAKSVAAETRSAKVAEALKRLQPLTSEEQKERDKKIAEAKLERQKAEAVQDAAKAIKDIEKSSIKIAQLDRKLQEVKAGLPKNFELGQNLWAQHDKVRGTYKIPFTPEEFKRINQSRAAEDMQKLKIVNQNSAEAEQQAKNAFRGNEVKVDGEYVQQGKVMDEVRPFQEALGQVVLDLKKQKGILESSRQLLQTMAASQEDRYSEAKKTIPPELLEG